MTENYRRARARNSNRNRHREIASSAKGLLAMTNIVQWLNRWRVALSGGFGKGIFEGFVGLGDAGL